MSKKNDIFIKPIIRNPFDDQQKLFRVGDASIIFDVGAQFGQTALEYSKRFKNSRIYSFEPFNESFEIMRDNVMKEPNVRIYNIGFGDAIGKKEINSNTFSATNSILDTDDKAASTWGDNLLETIKKTEVNITTIDKFTEEQKIKTIDILKIDVQGYEFKVLEGARNLILKNEIKIIYLEIIILPTYKNQKQLDEVLSLLRSYNFSLYNFYNFSYDSFGSLRQLDAVFICNKYKNNFLISLPA